MSGGEPLSRPRLVRDLAEIAHEYGTKTYAITGLFFASHRVLPSEVADAVANLDHLAVSIDEYHEREIPREMALDCVEDLLNRGLSLSIQTVHTGRRDPYVDSLLIDVERRFGRQIPVFSLLLKSHGRAADWYDAPVPSCDPAEVTLSPCKVASWPVVRYDGSVVACCNQTVIDGIAPPHLSLGNIATMSWPELREQVVRSEMLRLIRTYGPIGTAQRLGAGCLATQCGTCKGLSVSTDAAAVANLMNVTATRIIEVAVQDAASSVTAYSFAERHGDWLLWGLHG